MSHYSPVVLRVGTPERTATARALIVHHRAGRLPRPDLDARLALAAAAGTEDDLRGLLLDLPDLPPPSPTASPARVNAASAGQNEQLRVAFDIAVLLIAAAAFVCTGLLLAVASTSFRGDELVALGLAVFGSFTVGAGGVHLAHRLRR